MSKQFDFDPRFQHPFTGPTQFGKSHFVFQIIDLCSVAIFLPPERIVWCYGEYQKTFSDRSGDVEFVEDLPDATLLDGRRIFFFTYFFYSF